MRLATFKHISSKNADYSAAEAYLTFEHDEFTMKPTLDKNGRLIPRQDYRISTLNCGDEDFAIACLRANLRYGKNQKREDVKSHHYIISFDPKDVPDHGLNVDLAQSMGEKFCKEHFPGHQAIVCTHPDGHNGSGNVHVHIVINSLRIEEVPFMPYMDRPCDTQPGMCRSFAKTNADPQEQARAICSPVSCDALTAKKSSTTARATALNLVKITLCAPLPVKEAKRFVTLTSSVRWYWKKVRFST